MTSKQTSSERPQGWTGAFAAGEAGTGAVSGSSGRVSDEAAGVRLGPQEQISHEEGSGKDATCSRTPSGTPDGVLTGREALEDARLESLAHAIELSEVRLEKVVRLRLAIASGEYRVSAADLADKMIRDFTCGSSPDERG